MPARAIAEDPRQAANAHLARQSGGGHHQRHGGAGPWQYRPARLQAGDGRQGRACSRNSPASTCSTSRSTRPTRTRFVDIVAALEPTFGGINLEDIKAPECFIIERELRERMKIPVFHDDQHGTAIIVAAAVLNGLKLAGKDIGQVKLAVLGRGRGGARLPRPAGQAGPEAREHLHLRHRGRRLPGPHGQHGPGEGRATPRTPARARWPRSCPARTFSSACRPAAC